jgi:hypothetical protein
MEAVEPAGIRNERRPLGLEDLPDGPVSEPGMRMGLALATAWSTSQAFSSS